MDSLLSLLGKSDKFMGSVAVSLNQKSIYQKTVGFARLAITKKQIYLQNIGLVQFQKCLPQRWF